MRTIHKYEIPIVDEFEIQMPERAQILCVQDQRGTPVLWAIVETRLPNEMRRFLLRGTGHDCSAFAITKANHVGTFQAKDGQLVFHLFEDR